MTNRFAGRTLKRTTTSETPHPSKKANIDDVKFHLRRLLTDPQSNIGPTDNLLNDLLEATFMTKKRLFETKDDVTSLASELLSHVTDSKQRAQQIVAHVKAVAPLCNDKNEFIFGTAHSQDDVTQNLATVKGQLWPNIDRRKTDEKCPNCGSNVYQRTQQERSFDEEASLYNMCANSACGHFW